MTAVALAGRSSMTLGAQLSAALGSTRINNGAATSSRHAGTKAMRALTLQDAGLICSFHLNAFSVVFRVLRGGTRYAFDPALSTAALVDKSGRCR